MKRSIYGMTPTALREYFRSIGENPAKADIVFDGVYRRGIADFCELGFSAGTTERLGEDLSFALAETAAVNRCENAAKLLLRLADGELVETVLMRQKFGAWVCVSTQVGCAMGCAFCQSGRLKKRRSLAAEEIVGQAITVSRELGVKINGISVMGIGEPFDNFAAVSDFCGIVCAPKGLALGERHVTVSTCGIVPMIYEYAALPHPCNPAISLHAPNDALRDALMPINRRYPLSEVMTAAEYFSEKTNRRVTLEYVMLDGVNDTPALAEQLCSLIDSRRFYVNIIPYNSTDSSFKPSGRERIMRFYDVLKRNGIVVTMRRKFGAELKAACGQLRSDYGDGV